MKRIKIIGVLVWAIAATGMMVVPAAQAETAPFWSIEGARLLAKESAEIESSVRAVSFSVSAQGVAVTCKALKLAKGSKIIGSEMGEPGTGEETVEFSECLLSGDGIECKEVEGGGAGVGKVKTEALRTELVEKPGTEGKEQLLWEFLPATGTRFVKLKFIGRNCTFAEGEVTGKIAAEVLTLPGEEIVKLPLKFAEAKSWMIKFGNVEPEVILSKGGTETKETLGLTFLGEKTKLSGTASVSLVSGKDWSPLQ